MEFSPASNLVCNLVENNPIMNSGRTFASFAEFDEVLQAWQEETFQTFFRRLNKFDEGHPLREKDDDSVRKLSKAAAGKS